MHFSICPLFTKCQWEQKVLGGVVRHESQPVYPRQLGAKPTIPSSPLTSSSSEAARTTREAPHLFLDDLYGSWGWQSQSSRDLHRFEDPAGDNTTRAAASQVLTDYRVYRTVESCTYLTVRVHLRQTSREALNVLAVARSGTTRSACHLIRPRLS